MKYIVINDYPYTSSKKFFEDFELAKEYYPDDEDYLHGKLLNSRIYTLKGYKETSYGISYEVDIESMYQHDTPDTQTRGSVFSKEDMISCWKMSKLEGFSAGYPNVEEFISSITMKK